MDQVKFMEEAFGQTMLLQSLSCTNFIWSILEYFDSYLQWYTKNIVNVIVILS